MFTIYKKELKSYFRSVLGWLFMAVLLFFLGLYFTHYNVAAGTPYLAYAISSVLFFVLLMVPILTMKIWAEERRHKTDQLLFTAPVKTGAILWGKFLAIETIFLLVVLVFGSYMLIPARYGKIPFGENLLALFAFFLFGSACLSIGFFVSSWTENLVIAAILTYAVLMASVFMPNITGLFSATGNAMTEWMNRTFDVASGLNKMMNGIVDVHAISYYLSIIGLMLFGTWMVIQSRKKALFRGIAGKVLTIGRIVGVLVLTYLVNYVIGILPATWTEFDVTAEEMYSLSPETEQMLEELDEKVTIYVLADETESDQAIATILGRYEAGSNHITVYYKDPAEFPAFADFYTSETMENNSLIIVGEERHKTIQYSECFETAYHMDYNTYESYETVTGFDGEGQITAGIAYVTSDEVPRIYVVTGHEEYALPEELLNRLEKMNMELQNINLMQCDVVPEDADAILVCGPYVDFSAEDAKKVKDYLDQGGSGLFFIAFSTNDLNNYEAIFSEYGLQIAEGVIFEPDEYYYKELPYYLIPNILDTDVTAQLYAKERLLLMAQCRGMVIAGDADSSLTITPLIKTSDEAYSKTNVTTMQTMDMETGDIAGPFYVAAMVEKNNADGSKAKMIVIGTEYLVDTQMNSLTSDANYEFLVACTGRLLGTEEAKLISIPPKSYELSTILVSSGVANVCAVMMIIVIPVGLLVAGVVILIVRRRKHRR